MSLNVFHNTTVLVLSTLVVSLNVCFGSETYFNSGGEDDITPPQFNRPESLGEYDETATEIEKSAVQNDTFATQMPTTSIPAVGQTKTTEIEEDGFISVECHLRVNPTFRLVGGMFDTLTLPQSTMPFTEIELSYCTCFTPLDATQFHHNSEVVRIILSHSQFNLRHFEEKLGENCPKLTHIDLQGFVDVSVAEQPIITPERFAQIAHPDLLQRILCGNCNVLISNGDRPSESYSLEEMKERFLSSILQLRSLTKARETISTYQTLIDMIVLQAQEN